MNRLFTILFFLSLIIVIGCNDSKLPVDPQPLTSDELFQRAVNDAMIVHESEISKNLIAIKPENNYLSWSNGRVLVVTWTKYYSSYPVGDTVTTWWNLTWVTAVPELKDWYKANNISISNKTFRTEQLIGLPMNSGNDYFVEMWVKPEDLLRPSYDNEITDTECGLYFPNNVSNDYVSWFNSNIISSYYTGYGEDKYPWTRLGYTYDWGNPYSEIGLSEFIIKKDAKVIVKSVHTTDEYR